MNALELIKKNLINSGIDSIETIGITTTYQVNDLDCDCVNGDCSTGGYEY